MLLILAIEPDRRQASRLAALARTLAGADLVVADSIDRAIASLAGRVPDLILTSLLLSPKEGARLDELNGGGAPAQTLTIPVFAGHGRADGCDPAVFAAQIAEYLEPARIERDDRDEQEVETAEMKVPVLPGPLDPPAQLVWEDVTFDDDEAAIPDEAAAPIELSSEIVDLERFVTELEAEAEPEVHGVHGVHEVQEIPAPVAFAHPLSTSPAWPALQGTEADEAERDAVIEDFIAALNETPHQDETPRQDETGDLWEEDEPIGDVDPDGDLWMPLPAAAQSSWPPMFGFAVETRVEVDRHVPQPPSPPLQAAARPVQPIQDEWGFFDPEQCGFNALLAKLQEISK